MLSYLTKKDYFTLNTNTIIIIIILFSIIVLSRYLYELPAAIIEGFGDDLDPVVKEHLENYIKKEGIFQLDGKELQSQSRHPPGIMQVIDNDIFSKLYLRDFYIKSSFNSCVIDKKAEYVSELVLPILLRQGVRFFDFQLFKISNELEPVVAVNNLNSSDAPTSINHVKFINVLDVLKDNAFISALPNPKDPLFIHLTFCNIYDSTALSKIYNHIRDNFKLNPKKDKPSMDEFYYKRQNAKDPYVFDKPPMKRVFFFITINYESENENIIKLLELENVYPTFSYDTTTVTKEGSVFIMNHSVASNLGAREAKTMAERNMQNFTICVPDKVVGDKDFENYAYMCDKEDKICYPEPMLYGCQFMPTCYFNENDLAVYNDIFEKRIKSGFVIKHPELRLPDVIVQSNTYKGVTGNSSAKLSVIENEGKSRFPS